MRAALEQKDRRSTAVPVCIQQSRQAGRPLAEGRCLDYNVRNKTSDQSPASCATVRSPHRIDAHNTDSSPGRIDNGRERIKLNGAFALGDRFLKLA